MNRVRSQMRGFRPPPVARILGVLILLIAVFSVISPRNAFFSVSNAQAIGTASAEVLLLATGSTFVIVAGQIDLSVGSALLFSATVSTSVMHSMGSASSTVQVVVGIAVILAVGGLFGLVNGLIITRIGVPSFIVTLGTYGAGLGFSELMSSAGGSSSQPAPDWFTSLGAKEVAQVPDVVLIAVVMVVIAGVVLARTRYGLHCYATGSNSEGSRRAGIPVERLTVSVFVLSGLFAAAAGVIDLSRFGSVSVSAHQSDNLTAIAAVIIGGASLYGGRGSIAGTVVGTLVPVVLVQGFVIQGVNPFWQNVAIGFILIAAVAVDQAERRSGSRAAAREVLKEIREEESERVEIHAQ